MTKMVSVSMITYNQEKYIAQAIEGVVMQQTGFAYELIISDDCSTDATRDICRTYQQKYPDIIRLRFHEQNQGALSNFFGTITSCEGKYIAICDGDDYWADPHKLQKQVDFLENNPEYGLTHTGYRLFYESRNKFKQYELAAPSGDVLTSLITHGNHVGALTALFKRELLHRINVDDIIRRGLKMGDYPLWIELARQTKFFYMNHTTAVYRIGAHSASHFTDYEKGKAFLDNVFEIRAYYLSKYLPHMNPSVLEGQNNVDALLLAVEYQDLKRIKALSEHWPGNTCIQKIQRLIFRSKWITRLYITLRVPIEYITPCCN